MTPLPPSAVRCVRPLTSAMTNLRLRERRRSEAIVASVASHQSAWVQQDAEVVGIQNGLSAAALHAAIDVGFGSMAEGSSMGVVPECPQAAPGGANATREAEAERQCLWTEVEEAEGAMTDSQCSFRSLWNQGADAKADLDVPMLRLEVLRLRRSMQDCLYAYNARGRTADGRRPYHAIMPDGRRVSLVRLAH
jgi:hypothetical protein